MGSFSVPSYTELPSSSKTVSGTDISFTTPAVFNEHSNLISTNVTFDSTNNRVVFGYTDNQGSGGDGVGTAIVLRNAKASL